MIIDDIFDEFNLRIEDFDEMEQYKGEPISYVAMAESDDFPKAGEILIFNGIDISLKMEILATSDNVIEKILFTKIES